MNRIGLATLSLAALLAPHYGFIHSGAESPRQQRAGDEERDEITLKGTVAEVTYYIGASGVERTHLTLKSDSGLCQIHVGPSSYVSSQQFTFEKGDQIEVSGWNSKRDDQIIVLARQITKAGRVLTLRDPQGSPLWVQGRGLR